MKTLLYLNGKKITQKAAKEIIGADRLKAYIEEAKAGFFTDPYEEQSWYTRHGMLTIKFK